MELIGIVSAVVLVAAAFCFKAFGPIRLGEDEKGLSTLEWMLIVAAVGGLATLGVLIVRSSLGSTDDIEETVDNPTVMAARETVALIDNEAECLSSDAGGHMGVKTQWDADEEECIVVEGANRNAATADIEADYISDLLSTIDTGGVDDAKRGCEEGENADGFFALGLAAGSTLTLILPTMTECSGGKWISGGDYEGYTFGSASIQSVTRCYTAGTGNEGVICAEDPRASSTSSSLSASDGANAPYRMPETNDPTSRAGIRDTGGATPDRDLLVAQNAGVADQDDKVACSSEGSNPPNECKNGETTLTRGLYRATIEITIEHASKTDVSYLVTDYLFVSL